MNSKVVSLFQRKNTEVKPQTESNLAEIGKYLEREQELKQVSTQMMEDTQQLSSGFQESHSFSEEVLNHTKQMAVMNNQAENALRKMTSDCQTMVIQLDKIQFVATEMDQLGQLSGQVLQQSLQELGHIAAEVNEINQSTKETMEMMNELTDLSGAITKILNTVAEISDQTRLLSLNATIESARAGQAGAGFEVVAERIKKLSDTSHESVVSIKSLLDKVAKATKKVNQKMEATAVKIQGSTSKFQQVGQNLERIQNSFGELVSRSQAVHQGIVTEKSRALEFQHQVIELQTKSGQAVKQVETVYQRVQQNKAMMGELKNLGSRLSESAASLESSLK